MAESIYIGVDVGVSGAVAYVSSDGKYVDAIDIPTITTKVNGKTKAGNARSKRFFNERAIVDYLTELQQLCALEGYQLHAMIENVTSMPRDGNMAAFSFGLAKGLWLGLFSALGIPYEAVSPSVWRPALVGKNTEKSASLLMAQRMFPNLDLSKKKDHNRAEALLIAVYLQRKMSGGTTAPITDEEAAQFSTRVESSPKPATRKVARRTKKLIECEVLS